MDNAILKSIIQYENQLLAKEEPGSILASLIDDEFMEMGQSGHTYDKRDVIQWLNRPGLSERTGSDFQVKIITDDVILLTYLSHIKNKDTGEIQHAFRSSLWRRKEGQWRMVFHQGTPLDEMI
ncbi:nuclear transport factor 2 family protein [Legionella spiritensis]|uniref:nuclear transport factor 2 family protein n=1 Tax=Legionella spiritensis TaxID=452 RepID=UPI000F718847|nr:DUF4440 domain-containing protein [Legionella spiritensis]VEG90583.1 Uncharacterized protein conserved in bacteria [Legionella spiritensis]